jgi:hypothetical protein
MAGEVISTSFQSYISSPLPLLLFKSRKIAFLRTTASPHHFSIYPLSRLPPSSLLPNGPQLRNIVLVTPRQHASLRRLHHPHLSCVRVNIRLLALQTIKHYLPSHIRYLLFCTPLPGHPSSSLDFSHCSCTRDFDGGNWYISPPNPYCACGLITLRIYRKASNAQ